MSEMELFLSPRERAPSPTTKVVLLYLSSVFPFKPLQTVDNDTRASRRGSLTLFHDRLTAPRSFHLLASDIASGFFKLRHHPRFADHSIRSLHSRNLPPAPYRRPANMRSFAVATLLPFLLASVAASTAPVVEAVSAAARGELIPRVCPETVITGPRVESE